MIPGHHSLIDLNRPGHRPHRFSESSDLVRRRPAVSSLGRWTIDCHGQIPPLLKEQGNHLHGLKNETEVSLCRRWADGEHSPVRFTQPLTARLPLYSERRRSQSLSAPYNGVMREASEKPGAMPRYFSAGAARHYRAAPGNDAPRISPSPAYSAAPIGHREPQAPYDYRDIMRCPGVPLRHTAVPNSALARVGAGQATRHRLSDASANKGRACPRGKCRAKLADGQRRTVQCRSNTGQARDRKQVADDYPVIIGDSDTPKNFSP